MSILDNVFKPKFYNGETILATDAMYNIIYGERSNGKSYFYKKYLLKEAFEKKRFFGLIFRHESDKTVAEIKAYFGDMPISDITEGKADGLNIRAGEIYFTNNNKKVDTCGYCFYLDQEEKYKSGTYGQVYNLLYEEFISRKGYIPGELEKLDSLVSTALRLRVMDGKCKVFLLGNLINRVNPYRSGWGLTGIEKQKEGTIDIYTKEFYNPYIGQLIDIKIAVERTKSIGMQNFALSKKGQKSALGEWEVDECLKISREELEKCNVMYEFVVAYGGFFFLFKLCKQQKNNTYFLYCERKTTSIKDGTRVIGDVPSISNLYTKSFIPLVERERFVFNLIKEDKVYFCDDLTAADFKASYNSIILLR